MPKTRRDAALLSCKLVALVCCALGALSGHHPPLFAETAAEKRNDQRAQYAQQLDSSQIHTADMLTFMQQQIDANADRTDRNQRAIVDMASDLHNFELQEAAKSGAGTWINGGTAAAVLASIGLQVRGRKRRRYGDDEEE